MKQINCIILPGGIGDSITVLPLLDKIRQKFKGDYFIGCSNELISLLKEEDNIYLAFDKNNPPRQLFFEKFNWFIDLSGVFSLKYLKKIKSNNKAWRSCTDRTEYFINGRNYKYDTFNFELDGKSKNVNFPAWMVEAPMISRILKEDHWVWVNDKLYPHLRIPIEKTEAQKNISFILSGGDFRKHWPIENWVELVSYFLTEGFPLQLIMGEKEKHYSKHFDKTKVKIFIETPLDALAKVLFSSHFSISNDCSIMHISAALGVPTLGIFGPTNPNCWFYYDLRINDFIQVLTGNNLNSSGLLNNAYSLWPSPDQVIHLIEKSFLKKRK